MDVFGQIRHFISLFIQYASWNPSKIVSYLKHNDIHYIITVAKPARQFGHAMQI